MYINNFEARGEVSGYSPSARINGSDVISGSFLETLGKQMEGWVKALTDSKITQGEISSLSSMGLGAMSQGASDNSSNQEIVYEDSAAYLYASVQINKVTNLMTFVFNYTSQVNELYQKASNILTG